MRIQYFYFSFQNCPSLYILYMSMAIPSQKMREKEMEIYRIWNFPGLNEFKGKCETRDPDLLQNHFFKPQKSNLIFLLHIRRGLNIVLQTAI